MRIARLLALYFVFSVEVRVHADLLTFPAQCWGRDEVCGARNLSHKVHTAVVDKNKIALSPQAVIKRHADNEYRLVEGKVLMRSNRGPQWSFVYGEMACVHTCLAILVREEDSVRILALEGDVRVKRLGDGREYSLPGGHWTRLAGVQDDGKGLMDPPQSLPIQSTLKEFANLYSGNWRQFRKEATRLVPLWTRRVEAASRLQKQQALRTIASFEAERARELAERRKKEAEDERLRAIFRDRNYFTP